MKRYDSYKDTGVEWIGQIPSHWVFGKIYQYSEMCNGSTPSRNKPEYWEGGTIPWMSSGEINKKKIREIEGRITKEGFENSSTKLLPIGTVMMGLNGQGKTKGTVGILEIETTCNQSLCGMIFKDNMNPMFSYYYLDSQYYQIRGLVGEGQREGISISFLGRYQIVVPPLIEQHQIVSFLDSKTSQIDELIQKKERKIELLKEYRTSLINQVVSKGLNPNVEMKDSGVEWIGEIPSHWEDTPLRYYFSYTKGSNGQKLTKSYIEDNRGEYPVYSGQTDNNGIMGFVNEYEFDYHFPLIFTTTVGAKFMTTRILQGRFSLSQNCLVMVKKKECVPSFVEYFLKIDFHYRKELIPIIIQPSLRMEDLDRVNIVVPPVTEQQQIVSYVDRQTQKIDSIIQSEVEKIELLKEYRQSLISEVVTGKMDVRVN